MFDVRFTNNGKEVLESYQVWHPDIIVLDIWMPVMTGYLVFTNSPRKALGFNHGEWSVFASS
jgi:CheY-like chemotaxis protein